MTDLARAQETSPTTGLEVAVIGMAGRFPGARTVDEFWGNLIDGVDAITHFTDEELRDRGVPSEIRSQADYVGARGVFPELDAFDAGFFNYTPADARVLDPQVRALHEEVYHALEDAGYSAEGRGKGVGLFLGATNNLAWEAHSLQQYVIPSGSTFAGTQLNDKDFAATRIAYTLGLTGPAMTLHSACSTSLVAIDMACRYLWTGACQVALAGGSGLTLPHENGYMYQPGMIHSPDGHCRPFDRDAAGTVEGNGAGVVVLKRLEAALRDGDRIYAVVKGSAVNNDGHRKVGYTAPSIEGQTEVIRRAYRVAQVAPQEIHYLETHGTGTALGDPIEVEALRRAFGETTTGQIGLGSTKASIGHLDTAAGVTSFIKACKVVSERTAPRSLNFTEWNANIVAEGSPFHVVTETTDLAVHSTASSPVRAGVSSFGIGGTNAHVILEEPPVVVADAAQARDAHSFVLGAASESAIRQTQESFLRFLESGADVRPQDLAWTLQQRQRNLPYRFATAFDSLDDLRAQLDEAVAAGGDAHDLTAAPTRRIVFLFSGMGAQYAGMARGLYESEPVFRANMDEGFEYCASLGVEEPRQAFFETGEAAEALLTDIVNTQLLLFLTEYSLASTVMAWGISPDAMIGHSAGELAAACLAGVFSYESGVRLVHLRATMMARSAAGAMTSVKASVAAIEPLLGTGVELAAENSAEDITVTGLEADIAAFEQRCEEGLTYSRIDSPRANHSRTMDAVLDDFARGLEGIELSAPTLRYTSNVTGDWITADDAQRIGYYLAHLRNTVKFKANVDTVLADGPAVFLELGPGRVLSSFVRRIAAGGESTAVNLLRHRKETVTDAHHLARAIGRMWEAGVAPDWARFHADRSVRRVALPLYAFDRTPYPVDVDRFTALLEGGSAAVGPAQRAALDMTVGQLQWTRTVAPVVDRQGRGRVIICLGDDDRARAAVDAVPHWRAFPVRFGASYQFDPAGGAHVRVDHSGDIRRLFDDLKAHRQHGDAIVASGDFKAVQASTRSLLRLLDEEEAPAYERIVALTDAAPDGTADSIAASWAAGIAREQHAVAVTALQADGGLGAALLAELDSSAEPEIAVRHSADGRQIVRLHPVMLEDVDPVSDATVIVCPAHAVTAAMNALVPTHPLRRFHIVPYATVPGPTADIGVTNERCTVGDTVHARGVHALARALVDGIRNRPGNREIVVWDDGPRTTGGSVPDLGRELRSQLQAPPVPMQRRVTVVAAWDASVDGWSGETTEWFNSFHRRTADIPVVLLLGDGAAASVLDLAARMPESGIPVAYLGDDPFVAPARPAEPETVVEGRANIAGVLTEELRTLLGLETIPPRADVFDLGLDSVRLTTFTRALDGRGVKLLDSDVHNNPSIAQLSAFLIEQAGSQDVSEGGVTAIEQQLSANVGFVCRFARTRDDDGEFGRLVLLAGETSEQQRARVMRELADLRVGPDQTPELIWPITTDTGDVEGVDLPVVKTEPFEAATSLDAVFNEIDRRQDDVRRMVTSKPVRWSYPLTGVQKYHFKGKTPLQMYLINLREPVRIDLLNQAMRDVVGRHGVMRMALGRSRGRMVWREHEPPSDFALPLLDLSRFSPEEAQEIHRALVRRKWTIDFKVLGRPMYTAVLIKHHERSYDILFQFDHSIFDAGSGQVLRSDLIRRYRQLVAGTTAAMPAAVSYRHLQQQFAKGPVDISADEIVERFELERWTSGAKQIQERSASRLTAEVRQLRFSTDLGGDEDGSGIDPFAAVVHLYSRLVARTLEVDEVALDVLFRAREYEGRDYSDMMGMMIGSVPVVVPAERGSHASAQDIVQEKFRLMDRHNIHFLNLFSSLRLMMKFGKVFTATKSVKPKGNSQTCMLNYAGNLEAEYDEIWDMTLDQLSTEQDKLDYADFYCVAKTTGTRLDLLFLTRWDVPSDELHGILLEEVEALREDIHAP
ncbi:type I polyketide synthase [Microbacterium amylolyticum]|uniref:Acyl transferase domain-containing protein/aryl carrier-like protein n=1 Tax=Microbacterium amylolyticum TaxID=936337 RepID=A0ABS4ZHM7_9MICO|nr:type I polyketide synthase [Microbacterium amylolyticum]MBP2436781.1 acyl transferase domain-containing protein/aryl carrier-like protein [Microbacterium amylolyticum]